MKEAVRMPTSESTGIARELKALDKDTWNRYETAIIGLLGKDKFPLLLERDEWVAERSSTARTPSEHRPSTVRAPPERH